ncbi:uncharacterized protein LOC127285689 [Leptopilina boulardi]|uniref:uncharacterized protein LOC127285689 n=1 Tax=Leptopilina boulardi TaxID=63433 RepID=UPI0021F53D6E|nr:uncharacterized protein LOC127285689 [Leptopilina boulardi]
MDLAEISEEVLESLKWLRDNLQSWALVLSHWKVTAKYREEKGKLQSFQKVADIFTEWKVLENPKGYELIDIDFELRNFTNEKDSIKNWFHFFKTLTEVRPKALPEEFDALESQECGDNLKAILQLKALPHLVPPNGRLKIKEAGRFKHWKPSTAEAVESLIIHTKIAGDITKARQEREDVMRRKGLILQHFIFVVGETLENARDFFVAIDNFLYSVTSALQAIDICFKSFHVLRAKYPCASDHIWYIIQRFLYKFETPYDVKKPYALEIIQALKNLESKQTLNKEAETNMEC